MGKPRVLVLRAAGTNCDRETAYAFELAGAAPEIVHVNQFTRGDRRLSEFRILALPGGFSYGDDCSAGRIHANELRCLMGDQFREFVAAGKLVLGICNGFQILVKAGLLPGGTLKPGDAPSDEVFAPQNVTLADNRSGRFQCEWARLKVNEAASPQFLAGMDGEVLELPIAHGEGRFSASKDEVSRLQSEQRVALQYCGPAGEIEARYSVNGSLLNAAGISGFGGHVLGLMPHPERHVHGTQHPRWTREGARSEGQGLRLFRNAVRYVQ
jgi:phosphoribosylformylglycinamidine synthase